MNNVIINADTDSLMVAKADGSPWSEEEQDSFLEALNAQFPPLIKWEHDGVYSSVVVVKSKNYALLPEGETKIKIKGSSIKDAKKEKALSEMMSAMIEAMIYDKVDTVPSIYHQYVTEALNITDISRWCSKKTITESITDCKGWTQKDIDSKKLRKNETDVWDAVKAENPQQGDKVMLYPTILETRIIPGGVSEKTGKPLKDKVEEITGLKMDKHWNNDHDVQKLVERVYKTVCIFETVLDMKNFTNFSGSKYYKMIQEGKSLAEIDVIYKADEEIKEAKKLAKAAKENET